MTTSLMVALLVGTAACGNAGSDSSSDAAAPSTSAGQQGGAVTIKSFDFDPDPVRIKAGTTVSWTNQDEILHNVTSGERDKPDGTFDEQLDGPGSVAAHTFDTPGTYAYHCSIHPGMDGVVEVS